MSVHQLDFKLSHRLDLIDFIATLGKNPAKSAITQLSRRRVELQTKIDNWIAKAPFHIDDTDFSDQLNPAIDDLDENELQEKEKDEADEAEDDYESNMDEDDEHNSSDEDDDGDSNNEEQVLFPEKVQLPLPSSIGHARCLQFDLTSLANQEIELRNARANESLDELRCALGLKSAIFRKAVRNAHSQWTKTRAWSSVGTADKNVRIYAKRYRRSRQALIRLGAPEGILKSFRELTKADLKMSQDIIEENRFGQRDDTLSWIWLMNRGRDNKGNEWINEGMFWSSQYVSVAEISTS